MNKNFSLLLLMCGVVGLTACGRQSTPSMMNTSRVQVVPETYLWQQPVAQVNESYLHLVANDFERYGASTIQMSLGYNPADKTYGAMQAFNDLTKFKDRLNKLGVHNISAETVKSEGATPTLMISYDTVSAMGPAGCRNMPGFDDGLTTAEIGNYKFGCSTEAMLAKQIYRPADLLGKDASDPGDGRRSAYNVEYYRHVDPEEAEGDLDRINRDDIQQ